VSKGSRMGPSDDCSFLGVVLCCLFLLPSLFYPYFLHLILVCFPFDKINLITWQVSIGAVTPRVIILACT
jgi:hypothetical protein